MESKFPKPPPEAAAIHNFREYLSGTPKSEYLVKAGYHFWGDNEDDVPAPNNFNMTIQKRLIPDRDFTVHPETLRGIYALDGDRLKLCFRKFGKRPTTIPDNPSGEDSLFIWVLHRETATFKTDEEKLQGDWKIIKHETDGQQVPLSLIKFDFHVSFVGDLMISCEEQHDVFFTLDTTKAPKQIISTDTSRSKVARTVGIYSLDGDDLKICRSRGEKAPTRFTAREGSGQQLIILKRVKGAGTADKNSQKRNDAKGNDLAR
jgi:uncharacterized protein (TIGR03067 family)